ncbi:hypothetical protein [Deinococcus peraridilitoris]|uniref:ABM domain-containing protein n=1 Tax=Deinococcus peraridilitoris (strain DSM 19664 / LMG 22246 / CIP 109416 / KR-200) TaxID=937777 RepID=L0A3G7_DEIPD|nr:hypothetical protein [Deinococcus peraridilitoris]AFZ68443.1 hypothetical protein Deipe_2992 [Deinococcus peraridilitoris DSM 19664]
MRFVLYTELQGEDALHTLRPLLAHCATLPGFEGGELLVSPAQPKLALLQSRWSVDPPALEVEGARSWSFQVIESLGQEIGQEITAAGRPPG